MKEGDKRAAIMRAALELVAERGFHDASMALISARAKVAAGTVYRYFECKDHLILQTYWGLELRLFQAATKGAPEGLTTRARFLCLAINLLRYCISSPVELKFLVQFRTSPYGFERRRSGVQNKKSDLAGDLFSEGVGNRSVKDLPPTVLFDLGFGPLFEIALRHHAGEISIDQALMGEIVERCWSAIVR